MQLGRWAGAEVIGTASAGNVDFVRSLGAQTVVDYTATPFESVVRDVDVVLDTIGGETRERSWQVLKPGGILVAVAGPTSEETTRRPGVRTSAPSAVHGQPTTDLLRRIADLIASGAVVPVVGTVFRLAEAGRAQALSEASHGRGRIIMHIAD